MKARSVFALATMACLSLGAGRPATAQTPSMVPQTGPVATSGNVYFSIGAAMAAWDGPKFEAFDVHGQGIASPPTGRYVSSDRTIIGGGPALTFGVILPWKLIGRRPRIEVSASLFTGSARELIGGATAPVRTYFVDGNGFVALGVTFPRISGGRLQVDTTQGSSVLRLKTDFAVGADVILTPHIGLVGGARWTRYRLDYNAAGAAAFGTINMIGSLKETVRSRHLGGQAGADVTWQATPSLAIHGGATFALMHVHATLQAHNCISGPIPVSSPCGSLTHRHQEDAARRFGVRLGASLGATWSWGWARLTLMGYFAWTSAAAGVRNPSRFPDGVLTDGPARIEFSSAYTYGGTIMMTFPLE